MNMPLFDVLRDKVSRREFFVALPVRYCQLWEQDSMNDNSYQGGEGRI